MPRKHSTHLAKCNKRENSLNAAPSWFFLMVGRILEGSGGGEWMGGLCWQDRVL